MAGKGRHLRRYLQKAGLRPVDSACALFISHQTLQLWAKRGIPRWNAKVRRQTPFRLALFLESHERSFFGPRTSVGMATKKQWWGLLSLLPTTLKGRFKNFKNNFINLTFHCCHRVTIFFSRLLIWMLFPLPIQSRM